MSAPIATETDGLSRVESELLAILAARNNSLDPERFADVLATATNYTVVRALSPRRAGQFAWFLTTPGLRVLDLRPRWFENVEEAVRRGAEVSALVESRQAREVLTSRLGPDHRVDRVTSDEISAYGHRWDVVLLDATPERLELMSLLRLGLRALAPGGRLLWAVASDDSLNTRAGITFHRAAGPIEGGDGLAGLRMSVEEATHVLDRVGLRRAHSYHAIPDPVVPEVLYQSPGAPDPRQLARTPYYAPQRDAWADHPEDVLRNAQIYGEEAALVNGFVLVARAAEDTAASRPLPERVVLSTDRPAAQAFFTSVYDATAEKVAAFPQGRPVLSQQVANHQQLASLGVSVLDVNLQGDVLHMRALGTPTLLQQIQATPVSGLKKSWVFSMLDTVASAIMRCTGARPSAFAPAPTLAATGQALPVLPGNIAWNPAALVPQGFVDLTVENAAVVDGRLTFFNQKRRGMPVTAGFVLYRSLVRIVDANPALGQALPLEELAVRYGLVEQWEGFGQQEERLGAGLEQHRAQDPIARWSQVPREAPQY